MQFNYAGSIDFEVIIIDPCVDIVTVTPEAQTNPADYNYDGSLTWAVSPQFTLDYTCDIVYSCSTVASPPPTSLDICSISALPDSEAVFDLTGSYTLTTIDMATYPPGEYDL